MEASPPLLWVTGAGSGMGRAIALAAAERGYKVALSGRRSDSLNDVARDISDRGGTGLVVTMDTSNHESVTRAHSTIENEWGTVTHVALSAGLNSVQRYWHNQSMQDFSSVVQTNLMGATLVVDTVLPSMRQIGHGTIVFISSVAGWRFAKDAGVAYSASKTALSSLSKTLNDELNRDGIRACHLCPGVVDTDFLSLRPNVPGKEERAAMLTPDDIAMAVQFVLDAPKHICLNELVITPVSAA
ncbi:SDR family oxidoreductase [Paramicrobacterium chengjingii]|uniref:SDR family oxidoreductase n=1 Tax=Paramicrobacterium chengjingii TaxID=2769067 RepID=A0ABX6YFI1_9MICO|nr:SDR family oxidoreductase [Microbacterium chengjingii]QPZ37539.1 SDR family oxidoreductase [Microbacterium chengjingii]